MESQTGWGVPQQGGYPGQGRYSQAKSGADAHHSENSQASLGVSQVDDFDMNFIFLSSISNFEILCLCSRNITYCKYIFRTL